ncbi:hypothetical protein TruAng_006945 [Truncatella angustata]|nr:hypothetical protein TruAng_006945 [Truncatella angustata]
MSSLNDFIALVIPDRSTVGRNATLADPVHALQADHPQDHPAYHPPAHSPGGGHTTAQPKLLAAAGPHETQVVQRREGRRRQEPDREVEGERRERAQDEEEQVLEHDRLLRQAAQVTVAPRGRGGLLLDARPGQVDVEQEEQRAQANDRRVELVVVPHQRVVE